MWLACILYMYNIYTYTNTYVYISRNEAVEIFVRFSVLN